MGEARLQSFKDEHRAEVSSLRHALEECVRAIATCARAIDTMCFDEPFQGADNFSEWEKAAGALREAAELGRRALGVHPSIGVSAASIGNGPCMDGYDSRGGSRGGSQAGSQAGSRPSSARRGHSRPSSSSGLWNVAANSAGPGDSHRLGPLGVPGEPVAYPGAMAIGMEGSARRACSGPPDNRCFHGASSHRFLVATPRQCGAASSQRVPQAMDNTMAPEVAEWYNYNATPCACPPDVQWLNLSDNTTQQPQLPPYPQPSPGILSGLAPPLNLLGSIPGLPSLDAACGLQGPPLVGGACNGAVSLSGASASVPPGPPMHLSGAMWPPMPQ